ncbi:hypothetical protein Lepto7375DRAFT_0999 [Leptolyngbya sp. PCC 7375]|uniref:Uncharacterized protein n=1 Tax=Adonisia turfae CCMR0081 TaxID=2292702 RepID=A0A6M0RD47_9CYAN|nr:hypothetical protein [Adonisia turfae]EKU97125.1 hypothetical protein Lepto7375DRAFT_0999 [Leptolyngbya sp. PCC 7375]NEZ54229.1 hypothetical protein [Adonisia turfae CCMR0081]
MGDLARKRIQNVTGENREQSITEIYQRIDQLSLLEKAALAQYLLNTKDIKVVATSCTAVEEAVKNMDYLELCQTLELIADKVRNLG